MFIRVDPSGADGPRLVEPADFKAFKIVIAGPRDGTGTERALSGVAEVTEDGEHAMVGIDALHRLAGVLAHDAGWQAGLGGMLDYARSKGWVDDGAQARVRAHLEWEG